MEKLTPQDEHQEHMVQILLAKMQGLTVESKIKNIWGWSNPSDIFLDSEYRIAPKLTPLALSREMWAMIDKKWNYAAMDRDGRVFFYNIKPHIDMVFKSWGNDSAHTVGCALAINIEGINWKQSLTKRPEDV
jgi:hypothetical protein